MKKYFDMIMAKLFCCHDWELIHRGNWIDPESKSELPWKIEVTYVCTKCGKFKKMQL